MSGEILTWSLVPGPDLVLGPGLVPGPWSLVLTWKVTPLLLLDGPSPPRSSHSRLFQSCRVVLSASYTVICQVFRSGDKMHLYVFNLSFLNLYQVKFQMTTEVLNPLCSTLTCILNTEPLLLRGSQRVKESQRAKETLSTFFLNEEKSAICSTRCDLLGCCVCYR